MKTLEIRRLATRDKPDWERLYAGYAQFYKVSQTQQMRETVWGWLMAADPAILGFGALLDGRLIGITHCRPFLRPLSASTGGFLDDLFVDPAERGSGAAAALIEAVKAEGRARGWTVIRWITADDNYRARGLYDRLATKTKWVTYDIAI